MCCLSHSSSRKTSFADQFVNSEKLDANFCSDVQPKSKAIDNLVMEKSRKDMIKALLVHILLFCYMVWTIFTTEADVRL